VTAYREVLGTVEGMQRGFTSGTCAQATAKAAALMLIQGENLCEVSITLKGGMTLILPIIHQEITEKQASCGIIKDSGDDTDVTHGKEFRAQVSWVVTEGITITGGQGVGIVTSEGLPVKPGESAINPNPRRMIRRELESILPQGKGFHVIISVPEGEALAGKTWNPRIGIKGGISIIGTSGIIEPKSSKAYKASIALCLKVLKKKGSESVFITPGYVGEAYLKKSLDLDDIQIIKVGDHIGYALDAAQSIGFQKIILVGHIGKMAKVASGIFNTHCEFGDARLETVAAFAAAAGADKNTVLELLEMTMAEASVDLLRNVNLMNTFELLNKRLISRCLMRIKKDLPFRSIILDLKSIVLSDLQNDGEVFNG
jgi:cobalt-precorrin-5B (C1)-methyltransferase